MLCNPWNGYHWRGLLKTKTRSLFCSVGCESVTTIRPRSDMLCPQINYDGREVPYQAIPAFISYNTTGRYIHELLDKSPSVARSVQIVLDDERRLERDILVASLGRESPQVLQNFRDNIEVLRWTVMPAITQLEQRTRAVAAELVVFEKLRGSSTESVNMWLSDWSLEARNWLLSVNEV